MRAQSLLASAALASSAAAFLITPGMMPSSDGLSPVIVNSLPTEFDVECDQCPFYVYHDKIQMYSKQEAKENTKIHLEFATMGHELRVNNVTVYPVEYEKMNRVSAHVVADDDVSADIPIEFAFDTLVKRRDTDEGRVNFLAIDFTVLAFDFAVPGLLVEEMKSQSVHLEVVEREDALFIVSAEPQPFDPTKTEFEMCDDARTPELCQLRTMIHERLRQAIRAARSRAGQVKEWMKNHGPGNKARPCPGSMGRFGKTGNPHRGHGPLGHHRGHHQHKNSRVMHVIAVVTRTFLIPAALGVLCGILASMVGMLVGRLIVFVWTTFFRGGRRGDAQNVRVIEIEIEEGEKVGFLEVVEDDAPPAYQDDEKK